METTLLRARAGTGAAKGITPCGHSRCYVFLQTVPPVYCGKCQGSGKWKFNRECLNCSGSGLEPERGYCFRTGKSYRLDGIQHAPIARVNKPIVPLASIERRDAVYSMLLQALNLNQAHGEHLANDRRLSERTIIKACFRTVPSRMLGDALAAQLASRWELKGVPGFWKKDGRWCLRFAGANGFFIPIKNAVGQIEALQIRAFQGQSKYLLVSSSELPDGVSSGAPHHFTGQPCATVIVTEGALKAEVVAEAKRRRNESDYVIGLVSVSTFEDSFGANLKRICPFVQTVQLAFDSDWRTNEKIQIQMKRFASSIRSAGLRLQVLAWESEEKGYDDLLLGGDFNG